MAPSRMANRIFKALMAGGPFWGTIDSARPRPVFYYERETLLKGNMDVTLSPDPRIKRYFSITTID